MINVRMQHKEVQKLTPKITVLGVGGAGGNAVNNMISSDLQGVEFIVCNTDAQALEGSMCENKVQLGTTVTGGLGAGAKPEIGREAAEESLDDVIRHLEGANMAFITAGMGGGTGTGAAPVLARACREMGILTVGVVTKPFHFEGTLRMRLAEEGIEEMQEYVDTLIVIPNQNLFRIANDKTTFAEAFKMADSVLQSGVRGVTDLMVMPGLINLDFADVRSVMSEMGKAMMGTGEAEGEKRPQEAAEKAINNPLLDEVSMKGAHGVIINVTGGSDMTLYEVDEACNQIRDEVDPNANIIFGSTFDERMEGRMRVSIVATGVDGSEMQSRADGTKPEARTERKLDRAQPNTGGQSAAAAQGGQQTAASSVSAPAQPSIPGQSAYTPLRVSAPGAPAPAAVQAGPQEATAKKVEEEEESVMFEQQEFSVAGPDGAAAGEQPGGFPQASVYNNAFIPPKPVDPVFSKGQAGEAGKSESGYGPQWEQLSARKQTQSRPEEKAQDQGLNLQPPVPGASAAEREKHKSPSLFERITNNPLWNPGSEKTSGERGSRTRAPEKQDDKSAPQGRLNIDAPKNSGAQESSEDELDIPAFLRRQAN